MVIKEKDKISFLSLIESRLSVSNIDWKELGNDNLGSPYRSLRPYGGNCECWGGTPEEEMEWHVTHLNKCVKSYKQLGELRESLWNLIVQESKRFKKEKKKVWERIKEKASKLGFSNISGKWEIMNCTNKKLLKDKEDSNLAHLENLANAWQKSSEVEKERLKKEEEERIKQEKQQTQAEETKKENQEEEIKQKEQEFKNQVEEESKETNPKSDKKTNDLKNKFREVYQKGKKYKHYKLMMLLTIIDKIEKETGLDEHLQEAKNELQIIHNKLAPYWSQIYPITSKEGTTKEKLEGLDKYQLENCQKALEEMEKIIYLNEVDKHLLEIINDKLKALNLQNEIEELKKKKANDPQQQVENQKKIEEKEKELEELKKLSNNQPQQTFEDNDNYQNLTHEQLVKEIGKLKKEIEELKNNKNISDSEKLLKLRMKLEKLEKLEKDKRRTSQDFQLQPVGNKFPTKWVVGGGVFLAMIMLVLVRNSRVRKNWNSYLTRKSNLVNKNIRLNENAREVLKWREMFDEFYWRIRLLLTKFKSKWNTAKHE